MLRFEGVDLYRYLRGRFFIQEIDKFPAHQLRAETQVGIFGERIVLPAAAHLDGGAPPDTGGTVKIEEGAGAIARRLFNHEMPIQHDRLQARQQIVFAVDVRPAHLGATHQRVFEEINQLAQTIGLGHKVRIEDGEQLTTRRLRAIGERAGLKAGAVRAMYIVNVKAFLRILCYRSLGDLDGFIGRIVKDLDLESIARVVNLGNGLH